MMEITYVWVKARNGKTVEMLKHDELELLRWGIVPTAPDGEIVVEADGAELRIMPGTMVDLAKDILGRQGYDIVKEATYKMGVDWAAAQ